MSDFTVNFPAALAVLEEVRGANKRITDDLAAMDPQVLGALAGWESEDARAAYDVAKDRWAATAVRMSEILNHATNTLNQVIEQYGITDKGAARAFGSN
ncbi:WXG100 family type VII secretion target [Actinoplanes sp. TRM 88003]|uniref:WXG100 family type VII secretion target n=1 Tax=Paractinoplanes aksuensis TaxID=2939490 RepID=A0ABT1DX96_9ACTN|nr:WXG100 family type VII secretion target [Actinoplanes aksuensis]MCO8275491.1 WXG100 family type VII secretion target [Actinoplanes aksuensis]